MRVAPFKKDHNPSETFIRQDVELKVLPYKENAMLNELVRLLILIIHLHCKLTNRVIL